ncbi:ATP-dependent RNA helicase DBP10 [Annulohypoxylon maeteangense]|uniref:ATP-dependent RNA helicase DBP10 n=1 Tax=Annulohypoxylon maeteangense TaxID=1927788 RepID=UPI0020074624|nr:ATP-dependent RNA helicase DBP10 [Annulohypoxylon maeteangense]KAI0888997.1 ATP-dependent RNA helicase DBP10 [Annulohypoxylon maeteangense]
MPSRAVSPARSENEVDILGSLFTDSVGRPDGKNKKNVAQDDLGFDFLEGSDDDDGGDEAFIALKQAASFRKTTNLKGKSVKKGGGFQAMGLNANLLRAITRKGFSVPTPIQRKAIPLIMERRDVVGMARTGSGKTAAFVIPMIERLRAHSATIGSRALILSPSRELAIQTLKVVKEFGRGTDLKCVLLVGGDSLEEQFSSMTSNPDIVIATPGRFLHLKVEMSLDLSSIQYVVFDEADRLFEMGFAAQLTEILHALPLSRQSLLFSATLPASLVEFARAGLQDPSLVRLDAETKISPDLQSAFFSVKSAEKEGALLHILHDVIKMPMGLPEGVQPESDNISKKRKRGSDAPRGREKPTEHSTIIFTATKHHVEYIQSLLNEAGFAVSYVYGSLDQTARKDQVENFRRGRSNILVVTDVAARGIDIPILANVINYDFPPQPKIFVHRVGRTARAGQRGWSYSLVRDTDAPYLLDLQLFLGKKLVLGKEGKDSSNFAEDIAVGAPIRSKVESNVEWLNKVLGESEDISALRRVAGKAEKLYLRTRNSASSQSARRAREIVASKNWMQLHAIFGDQLGEAEDARAEMLAKISGFKPQETIFEIGRSAKAGRNDAADVMKSLRERFGPRRTGKEVEEAEESDEAMEVDGPEAFDDEDEAAAVDEQEDSPAAAEDSDSDLEVTISNHTSSTRPKDATSSYQDTEVFMSYTPRTVNAAEERGYGVHSGSNTLPQHTSRAQASSSFVEAARDLTMDLTNDETAKNFGVPTRARMRWDKKQAKYVSRDNDDDGSRAQAGTGTGKRLIRGESGVKIAASFQSGRFDKWRRAQRMGKLPRVGEFEKRQFGGNNNGGPGDAGNGGRFRHKQEKAPKEADKFRDDYHVRKKRVAEAKEKRVGRFKDGAGSRKEIKNVDDIRKARVLKEKKKAKNARPSRK